MRRDVGEPLPKMTIFRRALTDQTGALHRAQARYVRRFRRAHGGAARLTQDGLSLW